MIISIINHSSGKLSDAEIQNVNQPINRPVRYCTHRFILINISTVLRCAPNEKTIEPYK